MGNGQPQNVVVRAANGLRNPYIRKNPTFANRNSRFNPPLHTKPQISHTSQSDGLKLSEKRIVSRDRTRSRFRSIRLRGLGFFPGFGSFLNRTLLFFDPEVGLREMIFLRALQG